jgi:hypothetical protein
MVVEFAKGERKLPDEMKRRDRSFSKYTENGLILYFEHFDLLYF